MPNNNKAMPNNNRVMPNNSITIILADLAPHNKNKPIIQTDLVPRVFAAGNFTMADKVVASCNYCEMSTILLFVPTSNHNPLRAEYDSWGAFILGGKTGENFLL